MGELVPQRLSWSCTPPGTAAAEMPARQLRQQRHALELSNVCQHAQVLPCSSLQR